MDSDAQPEGIIIPDFSNWIVGEARATCADQGVGLAIENAPDSASAAAIEQGTIRRNGDNSVPGTMVLPGGLISVVIFPLETREKEAE